MISQPFDMLLKMKVRRKESTDIQVFPFVGGDDTIGVAYSDRDSLAIPWVMQTTSLPLCGLHYPRLFK